MCLREGVRANSARKPETAVCGRGNIKRSHMYGDAGMWGFLYAQVSAQEICRLNCDRKVKLSETNNNRKMQHFMPKCCIFCQIIILKVLKIILALFIFFFKLFIQLVLVNKYVGIASQHY